MELEPLRKDIETCFGASCNFCERGCPVYQVLKKKTFTSRGKNRAMLGVLQKKVKPSERLADVFYQCTLCGNCDRWCALKDTQNFRKIREFLIKKGFGLEKHKENLANIQNYGTPYGKVDRKSWQKGKEFSKTSQALFFAGCTMPAKQPDILEKAVKLLGHENIQVMADEVCCASYLMRTGYRTEYEVIFRKLHDFIKKNNIKEIITACPGCYSTIKEGLQEKGVDVRVYHLLEKLAGRIESGELKVKRKFGRLTYHDPCHLGRMGNVFEPPRKILSAIGELVEMKHNRFESLCCGAGGGVRTAYPELSRMMGERRLAEAKESGATILTTACPFCRLQFRSIGGTDVRNVLELLEEASS